MASVAQEARTPRGDLTPRHDPIKEAPQGPQYSPTSSCGIFEVYDAVIPLAILGMQHHDIGTSWDPYGAGIHFIAAWALKATVASKSSVGTGCSIG